MAYSTRCAPARGLVRRTKCVKVCIPHLPPGSLQSCVLPLAQTAKEIYTEGGHSKSYAQFMYSGVLTNAYTVSDTCTMTLKSGDTVTGKLKSGVSAGANQVIECLYPTSDVQATYQACQVGGLPIADQTTTGCILESADIVLTDASNTANTEARSMSIPPLRPLDHCASRTTREHARVHTGECVTPGSTHECLPACARHSGRMFQCACHR